MQSVSLLVFYAAPMPTVFFRLRHSECKFNNLQCLMMSTLWPLVALFDTFIVIGGMTDAALLWFGKAND